MKGQNVFIDQILSTDLINVDEYNKVFIVLYSLFYNRDEIDLYKGYKILSVVTVQSCVNVIQCLSNAFDK